MTYADRLRQAHEAATPKYDAKGNFDGLNNGCPEHRTVGAYRAWCYSCSQWCYPLLPCPGCMSPVVDLVWPKLPELLAVLEAVPEMFGPFFASDTEGDAHNRLAVALDALDWET